MLTRVGRADRRGPADNMPMATTASRTTLILDGTSRRAAKDLAAHLDVSPSEAIRRALVYYRDHVVGVPRVARRRRRAALERLFVLFEGHDAEAEIRRLKEEDRYF
jgi:hypothetical protein